MGYTRLLVLALISLTYLMYSTISGKQQKVLSGLRRHKSVGVAGRFIVNREALEQVLQGRKQQDATCGRDVKLQLPKFLPHSPYNVSHQGEILLLYVTLTDHTLADELPSYLEEKVATSYQLFLVSLPVLVGMSKNHGLLTLHTFSNSTKRVFVPYSTNNSEITQLDSIETGDIGKVTLRLGDDIMDFQVHDKVKSNGDRNNVGKDFDKVSGKVIPTTDYPLLFDWGCQLLGSRISFCQVLSNVRCELLAVGGDVCTLTSTSSSTRSLSTMRVVNMTGKFQGMFPYLAETVPSESFEAETIDREHTTAITYPCLTL